VRDSPVLTIDTVDQKENHVEYSVEGGVEPYTMYLDKKERVEDPFGEVNNSFIGMHTLMVSDSSGCTSSQIYSISPVPIVPSTIFTPNGDGVNDTWTIENIDVYSDARVRIYDRNGKIIKEFYGYENETGWDGTYNGHLMPPTDYWYEINLPEVDTQYVGHFTLFYNIR
jgi:gliding motility-associated-like protein